MTDFAFEEISEEELKKELATPTSGRTRNPKYNTEIRTNTNWHRLPHIMGFCTVPLHERVQKVIIEASEEAREYREQRYPNRMTYFIDPYHVCRDCFVAEADIESKKKGLDPMELSDPNA